MHLRGTRDADAAMRFLCRACVDFFAADQAALASALPPYRQTTVEFVFQHRKRPASVDEELLGQIIRGEKPLVPANMMFARLKRRDRAWGVLALVSDSAEFGKSQRRALARIGAEASELLRAIDQDRLIEARARIDRKIMDQLRPIDLSYQILDALRSLTRYDHSSAVLMADPNSPTLEVVAEQIAWRKAKSQRIGTIFSLTPALQAMLGENTVYGVTRTDTGWEEWDGRDAAALVHLLDYNHPAGDDECREAQILCAPLRGQHGILGVLKVSACHPNTFGRYEAELLSALLPQASIAVQNSRRTESLETKMLAAERKHAMADLARGVSHDLNNALGAVLPLVQQLREEALAGKVDPQTCAEDLVQIERSLTVCRRIFGGMVAFARRSASALGQGQLRHAIDGTLTILEDGLRRRGINVSVDVADDLPAVAGSQSDLEQLLLNLLSNARDAMRDGGKINISASFDPATSTIRLIVSDTGCGIAPKHLPLVQEPFFTTKEQGNGLGLSICRSIIWEMRGDMRLESEVGKGTRVALTLPAVR
jgi:signal transduction histidine kinase